MFLTWNSRPKAQPKHQDFQLLNRALQFKSWTVRSALVCSDDGISCLTRTNHQNTRSAVNRTAPALASLYPSPPHSYKVQTTRIPDLILIPKFWCQDLESVMEVCTNLIFLQFFELIKKLHEFHSQQLLNKPCTFECNLVEKGLIRVSAISHHPLMVLYCF